MFLPKCTVSVGALVIAPKAEARPTRLGVRGASSGQCIEDNHDGVVEGALDVISNRTTDNGYSEHVVTARGGGRERERGRGMGTGVAVALGGQAAADRESHR